MVPSDVERHGHLARWEPPDPRHPQLDHESASRNEVSRRVAEARHLLGLGAQVPDAVPHEVGERELARDLGRRHVAHGDRDVASLPEQFISHRLRQLDATHRDTPLREWDRHPAGADRELEGGSVSDESGKEVDGRVEHLRRTHEG